VDCHKQQQDQFDAKQEDRQRPRPRFEVCNRILPDCRKEDRRPEILLLEILLGVDAGRNGFRLGQCKPFHLVRGEVFGTFNGRASLWTTLEMRSSVNNDRATAILGFDESFLRPFARALVEASTTRAAYRMTILGETGDSDRCRVVEYVTGPGKPLKELVLQPFDNVVLIAATTPKDGEETLFQLPRTDSFLRAFAKMAYSADQALHDLLEEMERVARRHKSDPAATLK